MRQRKKQKIVPQKTRIVEGATAAGDYCLPDECWETIFKFLIDEGDDNNHHFRSLSAVSKQFLSITNQLLFSLNVNNIVNKPSDFLSRIIHRFTNLNSLHLTGNKIYKSLRQISRLQFITLKSLHLNCKLSQFPSDALRLVSRNITTLTSLTCSHVPTFYSHHLLLIAACFPLLEQLDLSSPNFPKRIWQHHNSLNEGVKALSSSLLKLRKVDLTGHYYMDDQSLCYLFKNLKFLEEAIIIGCYHITNNGVANALRERPNLRSFSFTSYSYFDPEHAANNFIVCPQLMSLAFTFGHVSKTGIGILFASIFPNLQLLDLSRCSLYVDDIFHVLRNCTKIKQLNLTNYSGMMWHEMNFDVPNLEVLNLSHTMVEDEDLGVISKSCHGLLKLLLVNCCCVTKKGVHHVVENCKQLREINLNDCQNVHANVVASMVLSRPSLRRIIPPQPNYCFSDTDLELFSRRRCLVQTALTKNVKL
ncbi:F-box/LRR-repeat protein 2-like [Trifolium pratense]|uniref:F-box/LRR-repeat protein 2-like n=1 Tax=Trifolium pratense TaxID=57577 RepID=UPI001E68FFB3|nr:F-box/LRR-repeat protein 2-like [Trifolium pratense]